MESSSSLPRQIQSIITEAIPKALKLYAEWKAKEKSLATLDNHLNSNSIPQSIQLKVCLSIPKCVLEDQTSHDEVEQSKLRFKESLERFQRDAVTEMKVIAETAVAVVKKQLLDFITHTDNDIIIFYYRLLQKMDNPKAQQFEGIMQTHPHIHEDDRIAEVVEVEGFIAAWHNAYNAALRTKLAKEVENEIANEKKQKAKEGAEEVIMDDTNNELVKDLIRRELKPIQDSVKRLNRSTVERSNSTGKQKDSKPQSKISWQESETKEPADANDGDSGRGKKQNYRGRKHTNQERGRNKTPRSKSPAMKGRSSPSPALKPILKKSSTSGRQHGRTRSGSSDSRRSRN